MILEMLVLITWVFLTLYCVWFFFRAKTYQPLTMDDLGLQWKLHKQKTGCQAKIIQSMIKRDNEIVGFRCSCGQTYEQKRLITQKTQINKMENQ